MASKAPGSVSTPASQSATWCLLFAECLLFANLLTRPARTSH